MFLPFSGTGSRRPSVSVETLVLLAAVGFAAVYNNALWKLLFADGKSSPALAISLFVVVCSVQFAGLTLLVGRSTVKPILAVLFLCTALASYFMDRYGVFLNQEMMQNVLRTDSAEAKELLTPSLIPHLIGYAALPTLLLFGVHLKERSWRRSLLIRASTIVIALAIATAALVAQYRDASALLRAHREARHLITPTNYLAALYKLGRNSFAEPEGPRIPIGLDAYRHLEVAAHRKPTLLVLVIGETVRSANFGLSGYGRQTTPELASINLAVYPRVQACGTSTEVSLPCMFSAVGRRDYDEHRIDRAESLLHLLSRVGYAITWIDNQAGCKGVCDGLTQVRIPGDADRQLCDGDRCLDEILLPRLAEVAEGELKDSVVVLHMLGNHGPAYSRRYPEAFRRFVPTCDKPDLGDCSRTEIVNAYDNAILYTDHVLASTIRYLESQPAWASGLVYVSDHGESLGESGLYLHGLPWKLAPREQKEVPMLIWMSAELQDTASVPVGCLARSSSANVTHDHLFHSILGLLQVQTAIREPALDLFSQCRPKATPQLVMSAL